jgi:hypothetical protein
MLICRVKNMLRELLLEKSGLNWSDRVIIYDEDGLLIRAAATGDDKRVFRWISSEEELRCIYERDYRSGEAPAALVLPSTDIRVPFDIMQRFTVSRLGFDYVFSRLDAAALRASVNVDFDYLSVAAQNLSGRRLTEKQTKAFYMSEMFNQETVEAYSAAAEQVLKSYAAACETYRDWTKVIDLLSKLMLLRDKGFEVAGYQSAYDTVDISFRGWMARRYASLAAAADVSQPVMLHHIPDFVRRASKKPAVIVVDGMSFVDWQLIREHLADAPWSFTATAAFSFLPCVTSIARQSLFSGAIPAQNAKPFSLADEEKQWRFYWTEHGLREDEIFFGRTETPDIPDKTKAAGIVVNFIDDLMHRQLQGTLGMAVDIATWLKSGSLRRLIDSLLKSDFDVFITSDHGHSEAIGKGHFSKPGLLTEDASRRAVIYKDFAGTEELDKFNVTEYNGTHMPKNYRYFLFANGECIGDHGKNYVTHGSDSIEELLAPFVILNTNEKL